MAHGSVFLFCAYVPVSYDIRLILMDQADDVKPAAKHLHHNPMCAHIPVCFQRNLVILAKARPTQMIFITTVLVIIEHS